MPLPFTCIVVWLLFGHAWCGSDETTTSGVESGEKKDTSAVTSGGFAFDEKWNKIEKKSADGILTQAQEQHATITVVSDDTTTTTTESTSTTNWDTTTSTTESTTTLGDTTTTTTTELTTTHWDTTTSTTSEPTTHLTLSPHEVMFSIAEPTDSSTTTGQSTIFSTTVDGTTTTTTQEQETTSTTTTTIQETETTTTSTITQQSETTSQQSETTTKEAETTTTQQSETTTSTQSPETTTNQLETTTQQETTTTHQSETTTQQAETTTTTSQKSETTKARDESTTMSEVDMLIQKFMAETTTEKPEDLPYSVSSQLTFERTLASVKVMILNSTMSILNVHILPSIVTYFQRLQDKTTEKHNLTEILTPNPHMQRYMQVIERYFENYANISQDCRARAFCEISNFLNNKILPENWSMYLNTLFFLLKNLPYANAWTTGTRENIQCQEEYPQCSYRYQMKLNR